MTKPRRTKLQILHATYGKCSYILLTRITAPGYSPGYPIFYCPCGRFYAEDRHFAVAATAENEVASAQIAQKCAENPALARSWAKYRALVAHCDGLNSRIRAHFKDKSDEHTPF